MPLRLIINADDFGLTRGINRAVAELHQAGVLTSATLMATGPAFDHALDITRALPLLGVGCHITLVDGAPVSPPREIPSLLGPDRTRFRPTLASFVRDLLLGRIAEEEIQHEALAQVRKLQQAGIDVTHVDTHKHTHIFPQISKSLIKVIRQTAIERIRLPFEPSFARYTSDASLKRRCQLSFLKRYKARFETLAAQTLTTEGTLGIAATGRLDAAALRRLLTNLPEEGVFELCCHPGYNDADLDGINTRLRHSREIERQALLIEIPKILALQQHPELVHYGTLKQTAIGAS